MMIMYCFAFKYIDINFKQDVEEMKEEIKFMEQHDKEERAGKTDAASRAAEEPKYPPTSIS